MFKWWQIPVCWQLSGRTDIFLMFSLVSFVILLTLVSFQDAQSSKSSSQRSYIKHRSIQTLTLKDATDLFRNITPQHFKKQILLILMDGRATIKINRTLTIPFHAAQPIAHVFPLFLKNVTIFTKGHTNNTYLKLAKLDIALDRLRKLLRHSRVLREIAMRNFSLWGRKKFIDGQKLINMFGSARITGGFDIIIKSLKQGKIWWISFVKSRAWQIFNIPKFDLFHDVRVDFSRL